MRILLSERKRDCRSKTFAMYLKISMMDEAARKIVQEERST